MTKTLQSSMQMVSLTQLLHNQPVRLCTAMALLCLQGCAASYVPVAYSSPPRVATYVQRVYVAPPAPIVVTQPAPLPVVAIFSAAQLDQLVGPIALYPDPLLAQVLPASTYPLDIVRAAQLVRGGPTEQQISSQNWDASVKAIAHYPSVLEYMDANLEWTQQLGEAFVAQPDDLMQSVQRLRLQASNLGNLVTSPQQHVVIDDHVELGTQYIRIIPAVSEIVYVPVYQPQVVYCQPASFITFGIGFHVGTWLDMDCDWRHRCVYRPTWTWNHWHDHHRIEHNRICHDDRSRSRHYERPSNEWHRDSDRPMHIPGRESRRADLGDRDLRTGPRRNNETDASTWPSQRETGRTDFKGEPTQDQPITRPNVPGGRPVQRPDSPAAKPTTPSRPPIAAPRPDVSTPPAARPSVPSPRPTPSTAAPSRPSIQPPSNTRPSVPLPAPAPQRPVIHAPARPATGAPTPSAAPARPSIPSSTPAARPAPAPRPQTPAPTPAPRPSAPTPAPTPSRPAAQAPAPSRPAITAPARPSPPPAARPSPPAQPPSAPAQRPDTPKPPTPR